MTVPLYTLEYYLDERGKAPFIQWLAALRDRAGVARIITRLDRVHRGNFGRVESVGAGVSELKIDYGPGYWVYFAGSGKTLILLLIGGDKSTQKRDIEMAKSYWQRYREE
jgi:putative addiction module killer protein